jgi:elongation factor P hydroxylase
MLPIFSSKKTPKYRDFAMKCNAHSLQLVGIGHNWYKAGQQRCCKKPMYHCSAAIQIFNQCFKETLNTELVRGAHEPIYIPRSQYYPWDRVIFAHGYFASALHEISHWCIAAEKRRTQVDFGYWYNPDGRTPEQQAEFEKVEIKPQALEWIFCRSANFKFNVSIDNLSADPRDIEQSANVFKDNIYQQVHMYLHKGLPTRAKQFSDALIAHYRSGQSLDASEFKRETL